MNTFWEWEKTATEMTVEREMNIFMCLQTVNLQNDHYNENTRLYLYIIFSLLLSFKLRNANFNVILYNLMKCETTMFTTHDLRRYWQWKFTQSLLIACNRNDTKLISSNSTRTKRHHHHCHRFLFIISVFATIT